MAGVPLGKWGGWRPGAGRKPKGERAGVSHRRRDVVQARFPVHVMWPMQKGVWKLRSRRCFGPLQQALYAGAEKSGFRLVHYAVLDDRVGVLVEAADRTKLATGMQGLGVRIARTLNRVMRRGGRVLGDRYEAEILKTPSEVKRVVDAHAGAFASRVPSVAPRTALLQQLFSQRENPG